MKRVTLTVRTVGDPEPAAIDQTPRRMLALNGGGQVWPRAEDVASVESIEMLPTVTPLPPTPHVETWTQGGRAWGWQCLTCREETEPMFSSLAAAETDGAAHICTTTSPEPATSPADELRAAAAAMTTDPEEIVAVVAGCCAAVTDGSPRENAHAILAALLERYDLTPKAGQS